MKVYPLIPHRQMCIRDRDETMEKREFEIYFQPKISLHNYKIVGAEALVRWRRPDGIVVRPEHFLPFYEKKMCIRDRNWDESWSRKIP